MRTKTKSLIIVLIILISIAILGFIYFNKWAGMLLPGFTKTMIIPVLTFATFVQSSNYGIDLNRKDIEEITKLGLKEDDAWVISFALALRDSINVKKNTKLPKFALDLMKTNALQIHTDSVLNVRYCGKNRFWDADNKTFSYKNDDAVIIKQGDDITVRLPIKKQ